MSINGTQSKYSWRDLSSDFMTFSSVSCWPLSRGYFGSWGHALVAVAVVERFKKQESMVWTVRRDKHKWPLWRGGR